MQNLIAKVSLITLVLGEIVHADVRCHSSRALSVFLLGAQMTVKLCVTNCSYVGAHCKLYYK
jgi:hypothetical protein